MKCLRDRIRAFRRWYWINQDRIGASYYAFLTIAFLALVTWGGFKGALWIARKNAGRASAATAAGPNPVTLYQTLQIIGH